MLKTLIKIRFRQMLSSYTSRRMSVNQRAGAGEAGMIILLFFAGVSILFLFAMMAFGLALGLRVSGLKWLYFGIMAILMFMLSFVGTIFMTKQQMFEAKDNHMLLSMPIKPRDILLSRVMSIGIANYGLALLIGLPFGIVYAIIGRFTLVGGLFFVLGVLIIPLLSLSLSILFGWALAVISSRLKFKNAVTLAFSTVFLMAYFYLCFSWQSRLEELIDNGESVAAALSKYLPPVYHFGLASAEGNILSFFIFASFCLVPFVIAIVLVSRNFVKIITTERGSAKIEYKAESMKASSVFNTLSRLELKRLSSSSMYMLNSGMGLLFILIVAVLAIIKQDDITNFFELAELGFLLKYVGPALVIAILYMNAMTIISSPTISLEAKTLWQLKALPLDYKTVLLAKAYPHIIVSLPIVLIACILLQIPFEMTVLSRIMLIMIPLVSTIFNALIGVLINLLLPKFNWINEAQAIKQGIGPLLAMLGGAIPAIIITIMTVINAGLSLISMDGILIVALVLYLVATFLIYRWLISKGAKKFELLQTS